MTLRQMLRTEMRPQGQSTVLLFLLLFFILLTPTVQAQQPEINAGGKITGRVIDSLTTLPIEYATLSLQTQDGNIVVNGATSDSKGLFKLTAVADGAYNLFVYFIGYHTAVVHSIVISKSNAVITLGDIRLNNSLTMLKEATVTAEKNIIENRIDKMVYHADKDITSQSGVASDILKKIPDVSIDIDGNVELQGNSGIRFLINGKPSTIFGNNIADVLQSIPASQVQSVEVITSPGAKYDAEGTAGIINIILKKSTAEGVNGNVSLSAGTRLENGSVNLNAHHGHLNLNAFFSGNVQLSSGTLTHLNRISPDAFSMITSQLLQNGNTDFRRGGYQGGVGFDLDITPHNNISGSLGSDFYGNRNEGIVNRQSILLDASGVTLANVIDNINTANKFHEQPLEYDLNYKKTFQKEDQELDIAYNSSNGNNYSYYQQTQSRMATDSIIGSSYGDDPGLENETNFSIDYTHPLSENVKIESGIKSVLDHIKSTSDVYQRNPDSE
jgi:ferric enterobactin receptor